MYKGPLENVRFVFLARGVEAVAWQAGSSRWDGWRYLILERKRGLGCQIQMPNAGLVREFNPWFCEKQWESRTEFPVEPFAVKHW